MGERKRKERCGRQCDYSAGGSSLYLLCRLFVVVVTVFSFVFFLFFIFLITFPPSQGLSSIIIRSANCRQFHCCREVFSLLLLVDDGHSFRG